MTTGDQSGSGGSVTAELLLPDGAAMADLETFVGRARQIDAGGAIRLTAHGPVLAVYAAALHGAGSPTVLAMRVLTLAGSSDADATVPVAALTDRFARSARSTPGASPMRLPLPSTTSTAATWAGVVPPRTGWSVEGVVRIGDLRRVARSGIEEVAVGTPAVAGAAAVARLRAMVWGRPLPGHDELPAGVAFAAETYGFLGSSRSPGGIGADEVFDQEAEQDVATLHRAGRWWRLSTGRGHVLARPAMTLA